MTLKKVTFLRSLKFPNTYTTQQVHYAEIRTKYMYPHGDYFTFFKF